MERKIVNTNIRLNMTKEEDRRAYEHLHGMDRKKYHSYSRAVVAAVNAYFDAEQQPTPGRADDVLFQRIQRLIEQNTEVLLDAMQAGKRLSEALPEAPSTGTSESTELDRQTALDFLYGF